MIRIVAALLTFVISLHATFDTSTSAVVWWEQPPDEPGLTITCLIREYGATWPAGICWNDLPAGETQVHIPGGLQHPAYRPAWGDRYLLQINGVTVGETTLGEVANVYRVFLPLTLQTRPAVGRVYLAVWRG